MKLFLFTVGRGDKLPGFVPVVYKHVVPACFEAPLNASFDLNDGHCFMVCMSPCVSTCECSMIVCVCALCVLYMPT